MSPPHRSHTLYVPSAIFSRARSMSAIEAARERAVAVVARRSTASLMPSPTRFPNDTEAPVSGGSVRRSSSVCSWARRARSPAATSSAMGPEGRPPPRRCRAPDSRRGHPRPLAPFPLLGVGRFAVLGDVETRRLLFAAHPNTDRGVEHLDDHNRDHEAIGDGPQVAEELSH